MSTDLMSLLGQVEEGSLGVRAAENRITGKVKERGKRTRTARQKRARRTGNRPGRPRTGRKDRLIIALERLQLLRVAIDYAKEVYGHEVALRLFPAYADLRSERESIHRALHDATSRRTLCADPDERIIPRADGQGHGVRTKREVLPVDVSAGYRAYVNDRHTPSYYWQVASDEYVSACRARESIGRTVPPIENRGSARGENVPTGLSTPQTGEFYGQAPHRLPYATRPTSAEQSARTRKRILQLLADGQLDKQIAYDWLVAQQPEGADIVRSHGPALMTHAPHVGPDSFIRPYRVPVFRSILPARQFLLIVETDNRPIAAPNRVDEMPAGHGPYDRTVCPVFVPVPYTGTPAGHKMTKADYDRAHDVR